MVDKRYQFQMSSDQKTINCDICSKQFESVNGRLRCSDECVAESKRRHAKISNKRRVMQNQRTRREQKEKLRMVRELTNRVEADEKCLVEKLLDPPTRKITSAGVEIPPKRKKNNSTSNPCVGIPKCTSKHKKRLCLKCQKMFDSIGPGNRVCATCQNQNVSIGGRETKFTPDRRGISFGNY
jgi:hypothetical protein